MHLTDDTHTTQPLNGDEQLVRFSAVEKLYPNGFRALAPTSIDVRCGEITVLVGPSGCGKTTLLRMAAGLLAPTAGRLDRATDRMAYVFQDPTLLAWRSVVGNVELVARLQKVDRRTRREQARRAIELVGLRGFERALPRELSGGMKMRASLARAIASSPELMLMDEPFAALDEFTRERLGAEVLHLWRERRFSALFITHSIHEACMLGHQIIVMAAHPGRIVDTVRSPSPPDLDPTTPRDEAALRQLREQVAFKLAEAN